jgi:hypothetical protein
LGTAYRRPTLKELASTREYRLTRQKGIRVGRSPDKSIGKTLSTGEWTDLILGRVRLGAEYEALKWYTWKSGTLDAEDTTLAAQLHPAHKTHHTKIITHQHETVILASCRRKRTHARTRTPTHDKPAGKRG